MGSDGSSGGDYDFFAGSAGPARPVPPTPPPGAPSVPSAPQPNRFGTPPAADNRFGSPPAPVDNRFGTPAAPAYPAPGPGGVPGQFGAPGQFGVPGQFGAPGQFGPGQLPPPPPNTKKMPTWLIALLGTAAGLFVLGVLAAVAIPVFLNQQANSAWKKTTVSMPQSAAGHSKSGDVPQQLLDAMTKGWGSEVGAPVAATYSDGTHSVIAVAGKYTEPQRGAAAGGTDAQRDFARGFQESLGDVGTVAPVAPGHLGGMMACARIVAERQMTACGSSDVGAIVLLLSDDPNFSPSTAVAMREAIEKR